MGPPAEKVAVGDESVWFYPRQPFGRVTYAVRIGPDNRVRGVEQRLVEDNIKKIQVGKTTTSDVRALFGPPYFTAYLPLKKYDSWEYKFFPGHIYDWKVLYVQFSADGLAQEVLFMDDAARNNLDNDNNNWLLP